MSTNQNTIRYPLRSRGVHITEGELDIPGGFNSSISNDEERGFVVEGGESDAEPTPLLQEFGSPLTETSGGSGNPEEGPLSISDARQHNKMEESANSIHDTPNEDVGEHTERDAGHPR
ncbi:hypothetical protein H0H93_016646, partial [Arthromyces matolae]